MGDSILTELLRHLEWILDGIRLPEALADDSSALSVTEWTTLISGFGGALLGAAIGAAASYVTARHAAKETRLRDEAAQEDMERSAALRMMVKASNLANSIETMIGHVMKGVERDYHRAMPVERLWTYVQPTTMATRTPLEFEAADFVFLLKGNHGELINRSLMLATRVAALEAGFDAYSTLRTAMQSFLEDYTRFDSQLGASVTEVPKSMSNKVHLRSLEMDNLIKDILRNAYEYKEDAEKVCQELNKAATEVFGGRFPITLDSVQKPANSGTVPL